jgi:hypothetical protein
MQKEMVELQVVDGLYCLVDRNEMSDIVPKLFCFESYLADIGRSGSTFEFRKVNVLRVQEQTRLHWIASGR